MDWAGETESDHTRVDYPNPLCREGIPTLYRGPLRSGGEPLMGLGQLQLLRRISGEAGGSYVSLDLVDTRHYV